MLFNSFSFLIFFPVVFFIYYGIASRYRPNFLLLASIYFYISFVPKYILVLLFLIILDYFLAKLMDKKNGWQRKWFLIISILSNLGTLFFFKYFNFFSQNIAFLANILHWNYSPVTLSIILPLGLSFHIFQSLSYIIEVYRKKYPSEKNFLTYALYVMFFPQLVAGPIERPEHLLPQFKIEHNFNSENARRGLERMLWGFFKKLVIADRISLIVNYLYSNLPTDGPSLILLIVLFSYELYCDFSGYADIAIGTALVLGFDLTENFNRPYATESIASFWRSWHISLSSWLRDYVYYPLALGWGKVSKIKIYISLFITFVLIGLWHGANWTFVALGAIHGLYLIIGMITEKWRKSLTNFIGLSKVPRLHHILKIIIVFTLVSISWVFFRAENMQQAWYILSHLGNGLLNLLNPEYISHRFWRGLHLGKFWPSVIFIGIILMETVQYYQAKYKTFYIFDSKSKALRYSWYYALILSILFLGYLGEQPFIYFKF